jgi:hypothetical protein
MLSINAFCLYIYEYTWSMDCLLWLWFADRTDFDLKAKIYMSADRSDGDGTWR